MTRGRSCLLVPLPKPRVCSFFFSNVALLSSPTLNAGCLNCLPECSFTRFSIDSDRLTITDVTENDAGVYTCIMNTTLDHDSASAELTVVGEFSLAGASVSLTHQTNSGRIKAPVSGFLSESGSVR